MRIRWLLEELQIDYDLVNHFRAKSGMAPDSIKAVSPNGSAPALVLPDGHHLSECQAIANYLLTKYDKEGRFGGRVLRAEPDDAEWLRDEELTSYAGTSFGPFVFMHFILTLIVALSPWFIRPFMFPAKYIITSTMTGPRIKAQLKWLEEKLGERDYFMGETPGRCDFMMSYPMDQVVDLKLVDIKEFPRVVAWSKRCRARDAWKSAINKGVGYDWACEFRTFPGFQ